MWAAILVAVVARLVVFVGSATVPIVADSGTLISPAIANGTDLRFYQSWRNEMFSADGAIETTIRERMQQGGAIAGPVFPILLYLFSYETDNTWPLALAYLAGGIALCAIWLRWLHHAGAPTWALVLFALLPHPIFYMICVGTEIPFSLVLAGFFVLYFDHAKSRLRTAAWVLLLLLLLLTRPNGLSVLAFVAIDLLWRYHRDYPVARRYAVAGLVAGAVVFGTFYYSYFVAVFSQAPSHEFFGISTARYTSGLFGALPEWLDRGVSLTLLLGSKLLYFLGIRPSYSDVSIVFVAARILPGVLLMIGLVALIMNGDRRHQLFVALFMVPILLVSSQDRYSVPIQPLLFIYLVKAVDWRRPNQVTPSSLRPAA